VELSLPDTADPCAEPLFPFRFPATGTIAFEAAGTLAIKVARPRGKKKKKKKSRNCGRTSRALTASLPPISMSRFAGHTRGVATAEAAGEEAASERHLRLEGLPEHCFNHLDQWPEEASSAPAASGWRLA